MEDTPPHEAFCLPRPQSQQGALTPLLSSQPRRYSSHSRPASTSTPFCPRTCLAPHGTPAPDPPPGRASSPDLLRFAATEDEDEDEDGRGRESGSLVSEVTVRGEPLTPFPPWESNSSREESLPHSRGCGCGDESFSRSMHAVVLALESVVFLGVVCLFGGIWVWRGGESTFWTRLWTCFQPLVGSTCFACLAMMLVGEARPLTDVGYLRGQAVVLCSTCVAVGCLAWWAFGQGDRLVVGSAVGAGG